MSETLVFGILVGFLHYYKAVTAKFEGIFWWPPFKTTIFSFNSLFKAIFSCSPPASNPTSHPPPPHLLKIEGSLSETKKGTNHFWYFNNKFNNILVSNTCFSARVSLSIYEWPRYVRWKWKKKLRLIIMPSSQFTHSNIDIFSKNLSIISIMSEHIFDQGTAEDVVLGKLKCFVFLHCLFAVCVVLPKLASLSQH